MKTRTFAGIILVACCLIGIKCTVSGPIAGTETGNPGFTTLAMAAFDMLQSDAWRPETYLYDGNEQLDPGYIQQSPAIKLAKQVAIKDTSDTLDTVYVKRVLNTFDTVILVDSVFIIDTLVTARSQIIVDSGYDSSQTFWMTERHSLFNDTVFIADTVLVPETTTVARLCTILVPVIVDSKNDLAPVADSIQLVPQSALLTVYRSSVQAGIEMDTAGIYYGNYKSGETVNNSSVDTANIIRKSDSTLIWISRQSLYADVSVLETYRDGDGDSALYRIANSASPQARLLASYTAKTSTTVLSVHFDAGPDRDYETTFDNRIFSLRRTISDGAAVKEDVVYGTEFTLSWDDSVVLKSQAYPTSDSVESLITVYSCIRGTDRLDHNLNRLSGIQRTLTFRSGALKKIELSIKLDSAQAYNAAAPASQVSATVFQGRTISHFDGRIDPSNGRLSGIYIHNGVEYDALFDLSGGTFSLSPRE